MIDSVAVAIYVMLALTVVVLTAVFVGSDIGGNLPSGRQRKTPVLPQPVP